MQISNDINLYKDVFLPPAGYELDWVEITTYSLAKDWLRLIPAMILSANKGYYKLKFPNSLIRRSDKNVNEMFHIFFDGKQCLELEDADFYKTSNGKYAQYVCEKCGTPVKLGEGLFHPKIILLQYKNKDNPNDIKFRVFVSSKNLTWSNYFEAGVLLEQKDQNEENNESGAKLAKFFEKYYNDFDKSQNGQRGLKLDLLKKSNFYVRNATNDESDVSIYFGKDKELKKVIKDSYKLDVDNTMRIMSMNPDTTIFEAAYKKEYVCNFQDIYENNPSDSNRWTVRAEHKIVKSAYIGKSEQKPTPLHIKQYLIWNQNDNCIITSFIGSANCSRGGLEGRNEEILVKFVTTTDTNNCPCKTFKADFYKLRTDDNAQQIKFYKPKQVTDPNIVDISDKDFPECPVSIEESIFTEKGKDLSIEIHLKKKENCKSRIVYWLATLPEKVEFDECETSHKFDLKQDDFTKLLMVKESEGNSEKIFSLLMNNMVDINGAAVPWKGKEYKAIKEDLEEEELSEIKDIIPEQLYHESDDEATERLQKCLYKNEFHLKDILNEAKSNIDQIKEHDIYSDHKKEIDFLENLIGDLIDEVN